MILLSLDLLGVIPIVHDSLRYLHIAIIVTQCFLDCITFVVNTRLLYAILVHISFNCGEVVREEIV